MTDDDLSESDLHQISNSITDEEIDELYEDTEIGKDPWTKSMYALFIFNTVSNYIEKNKGGIVEQIKTVNDCIKDLTGLNNKVVAKLARESILYSGKVDDWLNNRKK